MRGVICVNKSEQLESASNQINSNQNKSNQIKKQNKTKHNPPTANI
jgi:hypothetical protein